MKKILAVLAVIGLVGNARAQSLVAYWNFNELSIATAAAPGSGGVPTSIGATAGAGTLSLANWTGLVDDFGGSTGNALFGDPAEESLSLISLDGNGSFIQISFSMSGWTDLDISFDTRGTSTGFDTGTWSWSTDGSTFTDFGINTATRSTTYSTVSPVDTTAVLDGAATAYLRYTLNGATSISGNNRMDNLQLTAVPEPSMIGLFGLFGAAILLRRRMRAVRLFRHDMIRRCV